MLIVTHGAIGALIGENFSNPVLAFLVGLIMHYALDIIPHGDRHDTQIFKESPKQKKITFRMIVIDSVAGFVFLFAYFYYYQQSQISHLPSVVAAILGSILPDLLVATHYLNKGLFFRLNFLHLKIHELIKVEIPLAVALILQITLIISFFFLYKF